MTKKITKGDIVKLISGSNKGTTGKVLSVLTKKNTLLIEGIGVMQRKIKPSRHNPRGGNRDIHVATPIHKVALVVDQKTTKTSRVGLVRNVEGDKIRVARQNNDKEIK